MAVYQEKNKNAWTKDGRSWYFKCYYKDMYGNTKQKMSKLYLTKKIAQEKEIEFLYKVKTIDETDKDITFTTLYLEWLNYKKQQIKITTYYRVKKTIEKHILPYFSKFKLHCIKINTINEWIEELTKSSISLEYQNKIIVYLKEILEYAKDIYDFDGKIVSKIQKHRIDVIQDKTKDSEKNFWTYDEFKKFIEVVDDELYYLMFNFLYFTGLRFGEMIALNWNDINFEEKTLKITKSLSNKIEGQTYIITTPKTKNSVREIDLDDNLIQLLEKHYNREKNIVNFHKGMFIFGNVRYIPATTFKRKLNQYIKKAFVKSITPHGFRHSHASLLIDLGCDSRDVSKRLGDTVEMIEKTYYHMFPKKKKMTIDKINLLNNSI